VVAAVSSHRHVDRPAPADTLRESAVLVALADGPEGAEVLLTRRSQTLTSHRGEISFPGGRVDADETFEAAALREAHEEVALDPSVVQLRGRLDPISTMASRSYIVPVVATLEGHPFELDDETIWGATARILHQLLRAALGIDSPEPPAL
jgi:8-oxo-dGTP pyrophosphatase MutT (NUDIX family)